MAVQAQQYPENLVFALCSGEQEWLEVGGFYSLQHQRNPLQNNIQQAFAPPMVNDNNSLAVQVENQKQEIDRFIILQNERLRAALQEQRKQHMGMLIRRLEAKTLSILKEKEEDIARASKKTMELQNCLRRAEMENQAWQKIARENEAMIIGLKNTLEQVRENYGNNNGFPYSSPPSCCSSSSSSPRCSSKSAQAHHKKERNMACKACNSQGSCILLLPCRHLCACKSCETSLNSCPICKSIKKASIEVYMS